MSDILAAAAAALGAPEDLVSRSAAARAVADGTSVEEVLAAWSGGTPLPEASAPPPPADQPAPTSVDPAAEPSPTTGAVAVATAPPASVPGPSTPTPSVPTPSTRSSTTPILDGQRSRPVLALLAMAGLFGLGLLTALIIPSYLSGDYNHLVPDSELTATGQAGLEIYLSEGCWYCHTQMVRPVLADVGLGATTEPFADSLDTAAFGIQRIGPDLAHIGSRASLMGGSGPITENELAAVLTDPTSVNADGLHPTYSYLSESDIFALAQYLLQLK